MDGPGLSLEDGARFGCGFSDDDGHTGLDDARLFCCNLSKAVAQELRMVAADVCDDGGNRTDDVGTVQPSAQSHFDDGVVHLFLCEVEKSQRCGELEKGGVKRLEEAALGLHEVDDALLGYHGAVDADALAKVYQVWRGVQPDLEAGQLQPRRQGMGTGAFAVCTGHMDAFVAAVRVCEMLVQCFGHLQARFISSPAYLLEERGTCIEIFYGFLIVHFLSDLKVVAERAENLLLDRRGRLHIVAILHFLKGFSLIV